MQPVHESRGGTWCVRRIRSHCIACRLCSRFLPDLEVPVEFYDDIGAESCSNTWGVFPRSDIKITVAQRK